MTDLDLCYIGAREALARFRDRSLSPVELMRAVLVRADEVEPAINAFAFRFDEAALAAAREAEARYGGEGPAPRALEGLPVSVKDESAIEGQVATSGSTIFANDVVDYTSPTNQRVLDALASDADLSKFIL